MSHNHSDDSLDAGHHEAASDDGRNGSEEGQVASDFLIEVG